MNEGRVAGTAAGNELLITEAKGLLIKFSSAVCLGSKTVAAALNSLLVFIGTLHHVSRLLLKLKRVRS